MKSGGRLLDPVVTAFAPAVWGSTYLVTTELLPANRPLLAAAVRALPAGLILVGIGRVLPKGVWWWRAFVLGTLNIGAFFYFLFVAAYRLPGGVAALIMSFQPMMVLILAALLLGDRIRFVHVVACVVGAAGVALLVIRPTAALDLVGVAAALAGAACMAAGIVFTKRWKRPAGVSLLQFTGWQLTTGGLVLLPVTLLAEGLPGELNGPNIAGFVYLVVLGSLVGYSVWFRGIERLSALAVSFLAFASPIVATVLGYFFLDQVLTGVQAIGALIIIGAVVFANLSTAPPGEREKTAGKPRETAYQ